MTPPVLKQRWGMLAFLMLLAFLGHFNRISISVAGTERLQKQYALSEEQLGVIYASFVFMYTFLMAPGGWLIDRVGAVKALALMGFGLGVLQAATGLVIYVPEASLVFLALVVLRGIAGVTSVPLHPGASRVVSRWMPPAEQPLANGMVTAAAVAGISSTFYVFGALMDDFGWPTAFVIAGGFTLIVISVWRLYAREFPVPPPVEDEVEAEDDLAEAPSAESPVWTLLQNRNLIFLTLSYSAVGYFQYIFFFWIEHIFMNVIHLDKHTSRTYSTIALLSMAAGMLLGGTIGNRLSGLKSRVPVLAWIPICGMLCTASCTILSSTTTDPKSILILFSLAMAGIGACEGPMWTLAVRMGRQSGGTAAGIFNTGGNIGGIISPVLTPVLGRYFGWEAGLWIAAGLCILGAILWCGIDARDGSENSGNRSDEISV